jgi:hypothetical protein
MAKIFRTEELSVNGDSIRISAENGNLIFKDVNSNVVTSTDIRTQEVSSLAFKDLDLDSDVSSLKTEISDSVDAANTDLTEDISSLQAQRTSDVSDLDGDVSSLQAQRTSDVSDLDGDVSSLQAQRTSDVSDLEGDVSSLQAQRTSDVSDLDGDVSSLQAQRTSDVSDLDGDVSSLQAQRTSDVSDLDGDVSSLQAQRTSDVSDLEGDVSSLAALAAKNDVVKASVVINSEMGSSSYDATNARVTVDFGRTFSTTPSVVGIMKAAAGQPIIGVQLISISTTNAQFQLSDDVAVDGTYTIEVLASI